MKFSLIKNTISKANFFMGMVLQTLLKGATNVFMHKV
ncbi:hypothetical protein GA0116948_12025 [Chitinophaga costaii]|uniref:Uncharacterized protein n=1 Tax=Chitinophaga costaii TaxID=1335309 RepID=A0A1C4G2Q9_9BACT|nr:hypothetical protein GA0116948_12025 [Chitinophaga costaii]